MNLMRKYHKSRTIGSWRQQGLILTSKVEGIEIYDRYINSTNCEKCGNKFKSTRDKHMDHSHDIHDKYGYFRNVLCSSCNHKRSKIPSDNTSGYTNIYKKPNKNCKQGYRWTFTVQIDGKEKTIKTSINKKWLIKFAKKWKLENNYND